MFLKSFISTRCSAEPLIPARYLYYFRKVHVCPLPSLFPVIINQKIAELPRIHGDPSTGFLTNAYITNQRILRSEFFKLKGTIQKYFSNRGFGFIEIEGEDDNIFFHRSNYPVNEIPTIGQAVEFTIADTPKGKEAKEIKPAAAAAEEPEEEVEAEEAAPEEAAPEEEEATPDEEVAPEEEPEEAPEAEEDLDQMSGVGPKYRELLKAAGVKTIKDIAGYEADALLEKLLAVNEEKAITKRPPTLAKVEDWVAKAKSS
jgi:cold shock CspA family protein